MWSIMVFVKNNIDGKNYEWKVLPPRSPSKLEEEQKDVPVCNSAGH